VLLALVVVLVVLLVVLVVLVLVLVLVVVPPVDTWRGTMGVGVDWTGCALATGFSST